MLRRLFLVFLPSLTASVSYANQASWNCEQNKDSKEWVCIGEQKQTTKTSETVPPVRRESVKAVQPVITEPVRIAPTVTTKSVAGTQPTQSSAVQGDQSQVTQSVKNIQPAASTFQTPAPNISAPVENRQSVMPQAVRITPPVASKSVASIQPAQPVLQKPTVDNSKLPGEEVKRPGWNCDASGKDENWNCQLVGADPKGKAEAVVTNEFLLAGY